MHSTVFVMDVNSTVTGPDVRPGFHPEARYEFKVHPDRSEHEALTYRVSFGAPEQDGRQAVRVYALTGADARDDTAVGTLLAQGHTGEACGGGDLRLWAGRIGDPFYIDLSLLGIVNS